MAVAQTMEAGQLMAELLFTTVERRLSLTFMKEATIRKALGALSTISMIIKMQELILVIGKIAFTTPIKFMGTLQAMTGLKMRNSDDCQ